MPMVMVEIAPPEPPAELARALLDACSSAVRVGHCSRAVPGGTRDADQPGATDAVAVVRWETADGRRVQIEVGARSDASEGSAAQRIRTLEFAPTDPPVERWRSAGLTIATLAGEITGESGAQTKDAVGPVPAGNPGAASPAATRSAAPAIAPARQAAEADTSSSKPPSRRETTRETLWTTVAGVAGPGLVDGAWRVGAWADVGWRPTELPAFARVSLGFAARPADSMGLSVQWETVTLGVGGVAGGGRFTLQPRLAVSFDSARAGVTEPATGRKDSGSASAIGAHAGADVVFRIVDAAGLVASLDVWHLGAPTNILLEDRRVGVSAANGWVAGLGVRFFLQ